MKKFTLDDFGHRGALPPTLDKYIDTNNRAAETAKFVKVISRLGCQFRKKWTPKDPSPELKITSLFHQKTSLSPVGHGAEGSVYKLSIGDCDFALKFNSYWWWHSWNPDMLWIYMTHRSRHLFRRVYIGATYKFKRAKYDWNVSPWMVPCENQPDIQDRLMYIYLTKGIWYGDFDRSSNIINGRIVDLGTLSQHGMSLNRREIDIVKKLFFLMRTRCRDELLKKMDSIIQTDPHIIQYMIKRLSGYPSFANQCNLMRSYYEQSQKGREKS